MMRIVPFRFATYDQARAVFGQWASTEELQDVTVITDADGVRVDVDRISAPGDAPYTAYLYARSPWVPPSAVHQFIVGETPQRVPAMADGERVEVLRPDMTVTLYQLTPSGLETV